MRYVIHLIVSLLMWCLFGYYWYVVANRQINMASVEAVGVLAAISLAGLLVTIWWVSHNRRLASRNRRQLPPPPRPEDWQRDHLGRPRVGADLAALRAASVVEITLDEQGRKSCRPLTGGDA